MDLVSEMFRFNMVSGAILEGNIEELMDSLLGVLGSLFEGWGPKSVHFGSILEVLELRMASF